MISGEVQVVSMSVLALGGPRRRCEGGGRIILRWIFSKWDVWGLWTGSMWIRIGTGVGHFVRSNEHSGWIKCVEFLETG